MGDKFRQQRIVSLLADKGKIVMGRVLQPFRQLFLMAAAGRRPTAPDSGDFASAGADATGPGQNQAPASAAINSAISAPPPFSASDSICTSATMPLGKALGVQAALIGVELDPRTLAEAGEKTVELGWLLQSSDLSLSTIRPEAGFNQSLPFCLKLNSGDWVVVAALADDQVTLSDPARPGEGQAVPLALLQTEGSGQALVLRKSLARITLEQNISKAPGHWLWSRVMSKKTPMGNILAASLVANLLAAVVALFFTAGL